MILLGNKVSALEPTKRCADLFPSRVDGIAVGVRHRDIEVFQRRGGHKKDHPHIQ